MSNIDIRIFSIADLYYSKRRLKCFLSLLKFLHHSLTFLSKISNQMIIFQHEIVVLLRHFFPID